MKYEDIVKKEEILDGFSKDKKYLVFDKEYNRYFLRISNIKNYNNKKYIFKNIKKLEKFNIAMATPLSFGLCEDGVYEIYSWIDGTTLDKCIDIFSKEQQYNYGYQAGIFLKFIHEIDAPENIDPWPNRFNKKINTKLENYEKCPLKYKDGHFFVQYIKANRELLSDVRQTIQHGDFHLANMIVDKNEKLFIIDFDRMDYGNPWEEFNRISWCLEKSVPFSIGMLNAYFNNNIPVIFWQKLALYIATDTISSLPWAYPLGKKQINIMKNKANNVLYWYNNMDNVIPNWYNNKNFDINK